MKNADRIRKMTDEELACFWQKCKRCCIEMIWILWPIGRIR